MAGEGVFGSMIASLGQGYNAEQDKQREQARQDLLTKLAIQKETDARNKADFDQALHARESGLIPQTEVQRQYDRANSSPLQQASDSIPLQMAGIGNAPGTDKPMVAGSTPAPTPTNLNDPRMGALQKAAGLLSSGDTITMPTSHGAQPMIYDYASSKNAREAEQEAKKQQAISDRQDAKDAAAADRAAKAPVVLGPGQNRYDAQGNIIAGGPAAKPTYKAVQKADGTWTSVDEATGLDPQGKPVAGIVPKDPNVAAPKGSYQQDKEGNFIWLPAGGGTPINYGVQGAPKGAGGGGQSLSPEDRAKMLAQAKLDNDTMKRVEGRVLRGELSFGTGAGLATAAAGAHGTPLGEAISVLGNTAAGALDPDIQQYITANQSYGRIMGNLQSKRYTDNQAQIEKNISGMKGNDLKNTIQYKQDLRDKSLGDVSQPGSAPNAPARASGSGLQLTRSPQAAQNPAARWEQLVAGGMDKAKATAQVKQEFPNQ